jgi:hypothetical protein
MLFVFIIGTLCSLTRLRDYLNFELDFPRPLYDILEPCIVMAPDEPTGKQSLERLASLYRLIIRLYAVSEQSAAAEEALKAYKKLLDNKGESVTYYPDPSK